MGSAAVGPEAAVSRAHQDHAVRIVTEAAKFVVCLPAERRLTWFNAWSSGDPMERAYKEDMTIPAPPLPWASPRDASGSSSMAPPPPPPPYVPPHKRVKGNE